MVTIYTMTFGSHIGLWVDEDLIIAGNEDEGVSPTLVEDIADGFYYILDEKRKGLVKRVRIELDQPPAEDFDWYEIDPTVYEAEEEDSPHVVTPYTKEEFARIIANVEKSDFGFVVTHVCSLTLGSKQKKKNQCNYSCRSPKP